MKKLRLPTLPTLKKYGLSGKDWSNWVDKQDKKCPVCEREFSEDRRPVVDHAHVPGFKKMKPEDKSKTVRGLLCSYCNQRLVGKLKTSQAYKVWMYLREYDVRCDE